MPVVVHGPLHDFRFFKIALNVRTTMAELQLEMGGGHIQGTISEEVL